ncbi:MAG: 1-acyl-sn-glycerol-3-phosphate acyltransferase [Lachnospiraceae bacterium]|nr:1-acyl-sn-glycerol-3-phosphate acyltransferase [Lachnospiraceae bacterium]
MIRTVLILLFLVLYLIISLPLLIVEALISAVRPSLKKRAVVFRWVTGGFRLITLLSGARLTVIGRDRIPADEPVLYIGNHQSYFDIVISYGLVPSYTGYISKDSMKKIPLLSWLMVYVNCLFLDRSDVRQGLQTILEAIELIRGGISMAIYPEGTRNADPDRFMEFHKGSFKIAQRTNCPIVTMTINGSRQIFEDHVPFVRSAPVILEYGTPFRFSDLSAEDRKSIHTYTAELIRHTYEKNKGALQTDAR